MTSGAPWSVKGIDPKAREIAKDLARRSGMTLGEWLNQMILEDSPEAAPSDAARRFTSVSPQALSSQGFAGAGGYTERGSPARRLEVPPSRDDELERVIDGLDRLSARIEAAEHRSTLAISGIDQSVIGVLSRIESSEREQVQIAARFEGAIDEVRTDQARAAERLRRIEQESTGHRSAEAMRALESALNKVAGHLYEGETRTREAIGVLRRDMDVLAQKNAVNETGSASLVDTVVSRIAERLEQAEARTSGAIRSLEGSFAHLDTRLQSTEALLEQKPADQRLDLLANELSLRVEQVRLDMAEQIKASADGRGDRMERTLREMTGHVQAAERRSAQAIEKMGQEVLRMAESLNQKIQGAEHRNAEAIDQVGADVSRVATAVEQRLRRADGVQAEALEKLGAEIARITERLAERIATAERRSAHAIDDVGEQMARVTERFNQRQERASSELVDRMRQSEERTARLLEEAREKIDRRLTETHRSPVEPVPPPAPAARVPAASPPPASYADPFAAQPFVADPFADTPFGPATFPEPSHGETFGADSFGPVSMDYAPQAYGAPEALPTANPFAADAFPADVEAPAFAAEDFDVAQAFSHGQPPQAMDEGAVDDGAADRADFNSAPTRSTSTRELIAAARAAARQASQPPEKVRDANADSAMFGKFGRKKKEGSAVRTALLTSGVVAALGMTTAGYILLNPETIAGWSKDSRFARAPASPVAAPVASASAPDAAGEPLAATLTTDMPAPANAAAPAGAPTADANDNSDLYNQAKDKIKAKDPTGLDMLRKAANLGYAPAQFYLAKLYEEGDAGLKKDAAEARRWTQRAAGNGDPKAMHNLGLYYFHGDGGAKNVTVAALWFRRAADLGLVDSQYNLAQLYEQGLGVSQNPAEAYKWFLIAGRSGDGESKASADRLKAQLSLSAQQAAEHAAEAFRAESPSPAPAAASVAAADPVDGQTRAGLVLAQKALSKLGYYKGPEDGAASPALRLAIASYQKNLGMAADGAVNPKLIEKFSAITQ